MKIELRDATPHDEPLVADFNSRLDVAGLRLYVEQDNTRAQHVYASLGMQKTAYRVMQTLFSETGDNPGA